jgi:putative endonuclease
MTVYIIKSLIDGSFYIGMTDNFERRLSEHNAGKVKSTKGKRPWELAYFEEIEGREAARAREKYFKSAAGRRFRKYKLGM